MILCKCKWQQLCSPIDSIWHVLEARTHRSYICCAFIWPWILFTVLFVCSWCGSSTLCDTWHTQMQSVYASREFHECFARILVTILYSGAVTTENYRNKHVYVCKSTLRILSTDILCAAYSRTQKVCCSAVTKLHFRLEVLFSGGISYTRSAYIKLRSLFISRTVFCFVYATGHPRSYVCSSSNYSRDYIIDMHVSFMFARFRV
jgi:hypothetical protein